jgi:hypothetical protein
MNQEESLEHSYEYYKFNMEPPQVISFSASTTAIPFPETQISNINVNTFSNFLICNDDVTQDKQKIRFSGLSENSTINNATGQHRRNSSCSRSSSFPTDDSIINALKTIPATSPPTLIVPSSFEGQSQEATLETKQIDRNNTPPPNTSVMSCLLKTHSRTFSALKSTSEWKSSDRLKLGCTLQFPSSQIPESPIKNNEPIHDLLIDDYEEHKLAEKENEFGEKNLRLTLSALPCESKPIELRISQHKEFEGEKNLHNEINNMLQAPFIRLSTPLLIGTPPQKISKADLSPDKVLRGIDNGSLERKNVNKLKRKISSKPFEIPFLDSTPLIGEKELQKKIVLTLQKVAPISKQNQIEPKAISLTTESKRKFKRVRKKKLDNNINAIEPQLDQDSDQLNKKSIVRNERISSFGPNDLIWIKWRFDMYLVGKIESKPSSTRSLWSCKYLFQNKLSLPHFVTPSDSIPLSYLRRGDPIVNILSKSKFKHKIGVFEKWYDGDDPGGVGFVEMIIDEKCQIINLKSVAIHRNLFLELRAKHSIPINKAVTNIAREETKPEKSDELTSWTKERKRRETSTRKIKVILSGTADKKSVKDQIGILGLELVDKVTHAEILISEGTKRTAKYLSALALGLPIVNTAWLSTGLSLPKPSPESFRKILSDKKVMLLGDKKFVKDWIVIIECLGAIATKSNPDITLLQSEKYHSSSKLVKFEKRKSCNPKNVLLASSLAEMIVNRNFDSFVL